MMGLKRWNMVEGEMGKQMVSGGPEFERVNGGQAQQTTGGRGWGKRNVHFFVSDKGFVKVYPM